MIGGHPATDDGDPATCNPRAEHLAEYVRRVVAEAPPLTDEQRGRIAAILRGGRDG